MIEPRAAITLKVVLVMNSANITPVKEKGIENIIISGIFNDSN